MTLRVAVIGAGIVGLATGLRLLRSGHRVDLLERSGVAAQASRGNAGALAFSDILPLASPGILRRAPRWFLDPLGPLALRPAYLPRIAPWLWQFWRASQPERVAASTVAQAALMRLTAASWPALLDAAGAGRMLRQDGNLHLYDSEAQWRASLGGWQQRAAHGIDFEHRQGAAALAELQPGLAAHVQFGTFVPGWQTVEDPLRLAEAIAAAFTRAGGSLRIANATALQGSADGVRVTGVPEPAVYDRVVVCAGPWSHELARGLGDRVPLETERGYNTTLPAGAFELRRQLTFVDHGFVITRIGDGVRVGGAVELAGLAAPPNWRRADAMLARAQRFLPGLCLAGGTRWMGFRPSLPDSLPVIGPSRREPRVLYAFGHGHLGLTQAAGTAELVAEIVAGTRPSLDPSPFSVQRFH